jgi:hypothetical protein
MMYDPSGPGFATLDWNIFLRSTPWQRFLLTNGTSRSDYPDLTGVPIEFIYRRYLALQRNISID